MNKKILTSMVALGFVYPALAVPTYTSYTFPNAQNGDYMQPDYTYFNAAVSGNMDGVTEGEVFAVAQYGDAGPFTLNPGQYLPKASETVTTCNVDGKYCPGSSTPVNYSETTAQGLSDCTGRYIHSEDGASLIFQCYDTCSSSDKQNIANLAHADEVTGKVYYGDLNTCEPTSCVAGWHLVPHVNGGASNLQSVIGDDIGEDSAYVGYGSLVEYNSGEKPYSTCSSTDSGCDSGADENSALEYYGMDSGVSGQWAVHYNIPGSTEIVLFGLARINDSKCYCTLTGYRETGHVYNLSSAWKELNYTNNPAIPECARDCAAFMRETNTDKLAFRSELLATANVYELARCEANMITITWDGASAEDISANQAGWAHYGQDVRTPKAATPKPGKKFKGWKFVSPAHNQ